MTTSVQKETTAHAATDRASDAYLVHKVGSQLVANVPISVGTAFRTAAEYQVYTSRYLENPGEDIFSDPARVIYDSKTSMGTAFKGILLLPEYRKGNLTSRQIRDIREKEAPRMTGRMAVFLKTGEAVSVASNLGAIYLCLEEDGSCGMKELTTFAARTVSSGAYFVGVHFQGKGGEAMGGLQTAQTAQAQEAVARSAYNHLNFARRTFIVMNTAEIVGGSVKVGIETYHALTDSDQYSNAALVDGGAHIGMGASWLAYNSYLAREAAKYVASPATLNKGVDVLWVHARVIPPKILWSARLFGAVGPLISVGISTNDIYKGITDDSLDAESREHKIVSGTLGIGSSLCFVGFAFFMTPASAPAGVALFAVGLSLLAVQTAYDEWGNIIDFYGRRVEPVVNPFPELYEKHLQKTYGMIQRSPSK